MNDLIRFELSDDQVLMACIDMPGRSMNVFSEALIDALQSLVDRVESDVCIKGVVLSSGKPSFLAGADLSMVLGMTERATSSTVPQMFEYCGRLGRLFLRIEQSSKPWVAAVDGTALGGGLELAMACRVRLIRPDAKALIGLPEVKLGLLPGAGGTQRLPRLIGLQFGLDLLLSGRSIDPATAIAAGLFEAITGDQSPLDAARQRVHAINARGTVQSAEKFAFAPLDLPPDQDSEIRALAVANGLSESALRDYPAYRAIIKSVLTGGRLEMAQATDVEMTCFLDLMFNPVAANMVSTLFLERQRVEKNAASLATQAPESITLGPLSAPVNAWRDALLPTGIRITDDQALGMNQAEFRMSDGPLSRWQLSTASGEFPDAQESNAKSVVGIPVLVLSERSEHGRVIEMTGDVAPGVVAALARKMRCLLMLTPKGASLLQELTRAKLNASATPAASVAPVTSAASEIDLLADAAQRAMAAGRVIDPAAFDVAAVLAGISPAYTGGPLRQARHPSRSL